VATYSVFYGVLTRMDPGLFATLLSDWLGGAAGTLPGALALDGKMIRDRIGMVSLVEVEDGAPVAVAVMDQKENTERCELKVAQQLLAAQPARDGKTVTAEEAEGNSGGRWTGEPDLPARRHLGRRPDAPPAFPHADEPGPVAPRQPALARPRRQRRVAPGEKGRTGCQTHRRLRPHNHKTMTQNQKP